MPLRLRVFEERYLKMLADLLKTDQAHPRPDEHRQPGCPASGPAIESRPLAESLVKPDPGSSRKTGSVIRLDDRGTSDTTGWN